MAFVWIHGAIRDRKMRRAFRFANRPPPRRRPVPPFALTTAKYSPQGYLARPAPLLEALFILWMYKDEILTAAATRDSVAAPSADARIATSPSPAALPSKTPSRPAPLATTFLTATTSNLYPATNITKRGYRHRPRRSETKPL